MFKKAERSQIFARIALCGSTGTGKTYTALTIAEGLKEDGKIAIIDTERSSSNRYADLFDFDICCLETYSPENYTKAIEAAKAGKYNVLIIDSLSHAWDGVEGLLERVEAIAKRSKGGNTFAAWGDATPLHRRLVDAILSYPGHTIVTMRVKTEYIIEQNEKGKMTPKKVGLTPIQRQGIEYEFDIVGDLDQEHSLVITKSRAFFLADKIFYKPTKALGQDILAWTKGIPINPNNTELHPQREPPQILQQPQTPTPPPKPKVPVVELPTATDQIRMIREMAVKLGMKNQSEIRDLVSAIVGKDIRSSSDLTPEERYTVINRLREMLAEEA